VLGPIQKLTHLDPKERHELERDALTRRHGRETLDIERRKRLLSRIETRERQALKKALNREARQAGKIEGKARADFAEAARDPVVRKRTEIEEGDLSVDFNDVAEFVEGANRAGDDDEDRTPSWKQRAENIQRGHKPRRGKGYGYRRKSD